MKIYLKKGFPMEKQTITIYDVAREAAVSMATVSRVVNGNPNVKPATRKKVLEVIDRLDYRPNAVARGLASKKTTTVGVIIPDVTNVYFSSLARGIDDAELERVKRSYPVIWKDPAAAPQLCFVGCPHLTLEQLKEWTAKLTDALRAQNRLQVAVPTVFTAAPAVLDAFKDTVEGYKLQSMGVILSYICPLMYMNNPLCKKKAVITNSNKLRTYTSARYYTDAEILDILTGKEGR